MNHQRGDGAPSPRWQLMCIDLDGTLVRGTTVCQHLADTWLGHGERMRVLERLYAAYAISNGQIADEDARFYAGKTRHEVWQRLESIPCIGGIAETIDTLRCSGIDALLCMVTWKFAAECFQQRTDLRRYRAQRWARTSTGGSTGS